MRTTWLRKLWESFGVPCSVNVFEFMLVATAVAATTSSKLLVALNVQTTRIAYVNTFQCIFLFFFSGYSVLVLHIFTHIYN